MPRLVQWSRFSDAFQKLFGLQGATQLSVVDDCFLTLPVEEQLLHLAYLRGWKPFSIWSNVAAVAAQVGFVSLTTQVGTLAVVQGFSAFSQAGATFFKVGYPAGAGGPGTAAPGRDSRLTPAAVPIRTPGVTSGQGTTAVSVVPTVALQLPAGTYDVPFVVAGIQAQQFVIENNTVNQAFDVNIWGMYRELTDQER